MRDLRARTAIFRRIERAENGNLATSSQWAAMSLKCVAGYRVYFTLRGGLFVLLLAGGDKSTQQADIQRAVKLAKEV